MHLTGDAPKFCVHCGTATQEPPKEPTSSRDPADAEGQANAGQVTEDAGGHSSGSADKGSKTYSIGAFIANRKFVALGGSALAILLLVVAVSALVSGLRSGSTGQTGTSPSSGQKSGLPSSSLEFYAGAVDCAQDLDKGGSFRDYGRQVSIIANCVMDRWPDVECYWGLTSQAAGGFSGIETIYCNADPMWTELDLFFAFAERMGIEY